MKTNELENKVRDFKQKYFSKEAQRLKDRDKLLDYCIRKAWADAMQRERFEGIKKSIILQNRESIKKRLKEEIEKNDYAPDFDGWHIKMCKNTDYGMRVGVWQKFINMTFKYLYCIKEYFPEINFKYCHCPIDSVIAKKLRDKMKEGENNYELVDSIANSGKDNWNNINYEKYLEFEEIVRIKIERIKSDTDMSKLAFDFLNWDNSKS